MTRESLAYDGAVSVRFTFATTILPGREASYEKVNRVTPVELDRVIRAAGTHFEVNARWQLVVGPLLERGGAAQRSTVEDFEFGQGELVWELPAAD